MNRRSQLFLLTTIALSFVGNVAVAKLAVGDKFPAISLTYLNSKKNVDMHSYEGKVVLLDFWASDCAPCRLAIPKLNAMYLKYRNRVFLILGANQDEDPSDTKYFLTEYKVDYPLLDDRKHTLVETLGVDTMPTSYLVDGKGVVRYIHRGFKSSDAVVIQKQIEKLLGDKK